MAHRAFSARRSLPSSPSLPSHSDSSDDDSGPDHNRSRHGNGHPAPDTRDIILQRDQVARGTAGLRAITPESDIVQRLQPFVYDVHLSPEQITQLYHRHPTHSFTPSTSRTISHHAHPLLYIERGIAESMVVAMLDRRAGASTILDVGGNPRRHRRNGRNIHSACPILGPEDVLRRTRWGPGDRYCEHRGEECNCYEYSAAISIDSLYHLSPDVVCRILERCNNTFIAAHHEFDDAYGSFGNGEAHYQLSGVDTVVMHVKGNSRPYVHSSLEWLRKPLLVWGDKTLCWTRRARVGDHSITEFKLVDQRFSIVEPPTVDFAIALKHPEYYGPVSIGDPTSPTGVCVPGERFSLSEGWLYSWGPFALYVSKTTSTQMSCPKGLIAMCCHYMLGRIRNVENFRVLLTFARSQSKKFQLPEHVRADAVFLAACLAFVRSVDFETTALYEIVKPKLKRFAHHEDAMNFKFAMELPYKSVLNSLKTMFGAAGSAVAFAWHHFARCGALCIHKADDPFAKYRIDRTSNPVATRVIPIPETILPATNTTKTEAEIMEMPIDKTAEITPGDVHLERPSAGIRVAGLVSTMAIPTVPANTGLNSLYAAVSRQLKPQPRHGELYNARRFEQFTEWVSANFRSLVPVEQVKAMPFGDWNSKFPLAQRKAQALMQKWIDEGDFRAETAANDTKKAFVKLELTLNGGTLATKESKPRVIQAGSHATQVSTGPWVSAFNKELTKIWDANFPIYYTSGSTPEQIGRWFNDNVGNYGQKRIDEGDHAKYDACFHLDMLRFVLSLYLVLGCGPETARVLVKEFCATTYDRFGTKFKVKGTRKSGSADTGGGNSFAHGLKHAFCRAVQMPPPSFAGTDYLADASILGRDLPSFEQLVAGDRICVAVCGDDNLAHENHGQNNRTAEVMQELGFEFIVVKHANTDMATRYSASYCSGRFYPVADGHVFGPMIGRVLAKAGYFANVPKNRSALSYVRAQYLSVAQGTYHIPILRDYWATVGRLTARVVVDKVTKRAYSRTMEYSLMAKSETAHNATADTFAMVEAVYGVTIDEIADYCMLLDKITTYPCVVDHPLVAKCMKVDGSTPEYIEL
jgi:hypothetical protein